MSEFIMDFLRDLRGLPHEPFWPNQVGAAIGLGGIIGVVTFFIVFIVLTWRR